ncbi:MAG: hypothetical protein J1F16_07855 [Muribaculaceae bacterium]|nr:hypothetical protein [Muribaculaceae bacterium]
MNQPNSNINELEDIGVLMDLNSPNVLMALSQIQTDNKYPYILFPNSINFNIIEICNNILKSKSNSLKADIFKDSDSQRKILEHFCYLPGYIKFPERGTIVKNVLEEREDFNWITITIFIFLLSICIYVYNVVDSFLGGLLIFVLIFLIGGFFLDMGWFEKKYIREKILSDEEIKKHENLLNENYNKERKNFIYYIHSYYEDLNKQIKLKDEIEKIKNQIKEREEKIYKEEKNRRFKIATKSIKDKNFLMTGLEELFSSESYLATLKHTDKQLNELREEERKLYFYKQGIISSNIFERKGYIFSDLQIKSYKERHSLFKEYFIPIINNSLNLGKLNYLTNQIRLVNASAQKGYWEDLLSAELKLKFPESVFLGGNIGNYYPDIILKINNIWIDIEIDEPYDYKTRKEIHYLGGEDNKRNSFFIENNWFVVRFSERNILKNLPSCMEIIKSIIDFILIGDVQLLMKTQNLMEQICHKRWTKEESRIMALNRTRENQYSGDINL